MGHGTSCAACRCQFDDEDVELYGVRLDSLRDGDWFATNLAQADLIHSETVTGKLEYKGVGSALVMLDRPGWKLDERRVRWCLEAKVIKLPKPKPTCILCEAELERIEPTLWQCKDSDCPMYGEIVEVPL